jgi:Uracil phosphoribosyltransferase
VPRAATRVRGVRARAHVPEPPAVRGRCTRRRASAGARWPPHPGAGALSGVLGRAGAGGHHAYLSTACRTVRVKMAQVSQRSRNRFIGSYPRCDPRHAVLQRANATPVSCESSHRSAQRHVLLVDPMLASGGTALAAIRVSLDNGVAEEKIIFINLLARGHRRGVPALSAREDRDCCHRRASERRRLHGPGDRRLRRSVLRYRRIVEGTSRTRPRRLGAAAAVKPDDYGSRIGRVPGATTIFGVDAALSAPRSAAGKAGWS